MEKPECELYVGLGPEFISRKEHETIELGTQWVVILRPVETNHCTLYYVSRDSLPGDRDDATPCYYRAYQRQEFPHPWFKEEKLKLLGIIQGKDIRLFENCFYNQMPSHHDFFIMGLIEKLAYHGLVDNLVSKQLDATRLHAEGQLLYNGDGWGKVDITYLRKLDDFVDSLNVSNGRRA